MLPGRARPVGEHENVLAGPERTELIERRLDRRAGRPLQSNRASPAGREGGVELRQRLEHLLRVSRLRGGV